MDENQQKEQVVDYLRNRQKAAEINAKVSGVNLWVILGAIAIATWQLIESWDQAVWTHLDETLRVLLCVEAAFFLGSLSSSHNSIRDELRYNVARPADLDSPALWLAGGLWSLLPPVLFSIVVGKSMSLAIVSFFPVVGTAIGVMACASRLFKGKPNTSRFPKPRFVSTRRVISMIGLVMGFGLSWAIYDQVMTSTGFTNLMTTGAVKTVALISAIYLLVMVLIDKRRGSHAIRWTYELETDLLLGLVSPAVALRRIEHRELGPSLADVMNNFFDELDKNIGVLDESLIICGEQLKGVIEVPATYPTERQARYIAAVEKPVEHFDKVLGEIDELTKYLKQLSVPFDSRISTILKKSVEGADAYLRQVKERKSRFDTLLSTAKTAGDSSPPVELPSPK